MKKSITAVVLAAGKGTRMKSEKAKVLHDLCGLMLGAWSIEAAAKAGADPVIVVVGHQENEVRKSLSDALPDRRLEFAVQAEQNGTGHAVICAKDEIMKSGADLVLIICGDVPLLEPGTLRKLIAATSDADVALLSFHAENPGSYGRIVRDPDGNIMKIVEAADATREELDITEVNSGIYCVKTPFLLKALDHLRPDNAQGEFYLTDIISLASKKILKSGKYSGKIEKKRKVNADIPDNGKPGVAGIFADEAEVEGVNDRYDLSRAAGRLRHRINAGFMRRGVTMEDPATAYVDARVKIGRDSVLGPGVRLEGDTRIGKGVRIGAYSCLHDTVVEAGAEIKPHCVIESAKIGPRAKVGPFARLRPGTVLEREVAVGNFVETKKAHLRKGVKAGHLSYLGDADIGAKTNIGAGTITCNYDGTNKYRTLIGRESFIGSNSALVAPVQIGDKSYVGAGSTITTDIPKNSLGVARGRQKIISGWAIRFRKAKAGKNNR